MPSATESALSKLEKFLTKPLHESGEEELLGLADDAVQKAREEAEVDLLSGQDLVRGLELRGDLHRQLGRYDNAQTDYEEALALLESATGMDEALGRVCAGLAVVHEFTDENDLAKSFYERAIAAYESLTPAAVITAADLRNNLAFIYEAEGNFDSAETFLLAAVKACHGKLGPDHPKTAVLCNNVGTLYFKAGHDEQAGQMHEMALQARTKLYGEVHVETAQTHGNLALVRVRSGDVSEGLAHFEKALTGFESDLNSSGDDYEIVGLNYRDVLESMGDDRAVAALDDRLKDHGFS
ncbi:MAG: tetratricopeptide (TPR) repeat protein [Akkermansiaceae bacterium]|jgi:tetratricopeptide (TPR) repeat protein